MFAKFLCFPLRTSSCSQRKALIEKAVPYNTGGREQSLAPNSWSETTESLGPLLELLRSTFTRLS